MTIINIQPDAASGIDTFINAGSQSANYGLTDYIEAVGPASTKKILIKFDLSSVPAGSTINSATLRLVMHVGGSSQNIPIHRSLVDFYEGNGDGTAGSISGSTWARQDNLGGITWAGGAGGAAGTEYATTPTDTVSTASPGTYDWNVTSDVQDFVDGTATNRGWWLLSSSSQRAFRSSDYATASSRPLLIIDYTPPGGIVGTSSGTASVVGVLDYANALAVTGSADTFDTQIHIPQNTSNYGIAPTMGTGWAGASNSSRTLIKFNLPTLPPGSIFESALLTLTCTSEYANMLNNIGAHRSIVEWYEGSMNGAVPSAGQDASTWALRNANGSVAWAGGPAGGTGSDFEATATDTVGVQTGGAVVAYTWDVSADVADFYNGDPNYGWWMIGSGASNARKVFASSDHATSSYHPQLLIFYLTGSTDGSSDGTSSVTGTLTGNGNLRGTATGTSSHDALLTSNEFSKGLATGAATVSGFLGATVYIAGNSFGDSVVSGDIEAVFRTEGAAEGTSAVVANIKGIFYLEGTASGTGSLTAIPSFEGQMRGVTFGAAIAQAIGYAKAVSKAQAVGCNNLPLFYLTDGTTRIGGQLNLLNFLSEKYGFMVRGYRPQIPQYKEGGRFSNSSQSQGRRLRYRAFDNAIDILELSVPAYNQTMLIEFQQELIAFQEAAADYWISEFSLLPIYLVARAAREANTRYAVVHMISVPELENPYGQPFFSDQGAAFENLTVRIERGMWWSTPPEFFDCVEASSQREWTVSGWESGS